MFLGVVLLTNAIEMSRSEYYESRETEMPEGENVDDTGVKAYFSDGTITFIEAAEFEALFSPVTQDDAKNFAAMKVSELTSHLTKTAKVKALTQGVVGGDISLKTFAKDVLSVFDIKL